MDVPIWKAALIGLVQGLTEFLPVSSSGHLVLAQRLLGFDPPGISLEVVVHLGTLLAVLAVYGGDLLEIARAGFDLVRSPARAWREWPARWAAWVVVGTLPATVVAFALGDTIEAAFDRPRWLGVNFLITGTLLWVAHRLAARGGRLARVDEAGLGLRHALAVGLFQALAILPGVSRSGSTVAGGLAVGVRPETAARLSFLLFVPAVLGAGLLDLLEGGLGAGLDAGPLAVAFAASALSGYAAIRTFLRALDRGNLLPFALYTWVLGALALLVLR